MQFGFVTQYSEETVKFAASAGFGCIEAFADRGTALDLNRLDDYGIERIMEFMSGAGLRYGKKEREQRLFRQGNKDMREIRHGHRRDKRLYGQEQDSLREPEGI
jgi:hypothetical protein